MRIRNVLMLTAALLAAGCSAKKDEPRPSGLKNMAPPSLQESVQEGLDNEPNDSFLQASAVTMTGDVMQWSGTLTGDDADVFRIQAKAGTVADITVTPESDFDLTADISASGTDKDNRTYDTAGPSKPELLPNIKLTPQGTYLTIRGRLAAEKTVKYKVSVTRLSTDTDAQIEMEPNDDQAAAMMLSAPASVNGVLFPSGDQDYFRVHVDTPSTVTFDLPQTACEVAIEYQNKPVWSQISRTAQTLRSDLITPEKQDYIVRLRSLESVQEPLKYKLSVITLDKIPDEIEPNNTVEKAQTLQGDTQSLAFSLLDDADIDIFRIMVPEGQICRARLSGPQPSQATLTRISEDGSPNRDTLAQDMSVCDATPTDGSVLLKVAPGARVTTWPLSYKILIDLEDAAHVETEPNQSPSQATPLELDHTVAGHIFPAGDIDVYKIALPEFPHVKGPIGTLNIDIEPGYIAELQLRLQDQDGFEISQARSAQLSKPIHLAFDAPNGIYTLLITGAGDNCLKPYRLKASFTPNEAAETQAAQTDAPDTADAPQQPAEPSPPNAPETAQNAPQQPAEPSQPDAPENAQKAPLQPSEPQEAPSDDIPLDELIKAAQAPADTPKPAAPAEDEDAF